MIQENIFNKLKDKKVAILGFGQEGKSTYQFIRKYSDMHLTILDKNDCTNDELLKNDSQVEVIYNNYLKELSRFDVIIKSPGVILKDIDISSFKDKITSQLELILEFFHQNIIGVTGTKGKSTTSTLIYQMFKDQGYDTFLLGNIGTPIFEYLDQFTPDSLLVIEMSALQLEFVNYSPHVGIVLNLFEEHLDHAGTVEHYYQNKLNIAKFQTNDDWFIYALDNDNLRNNVAKYQSKPITVSLNMDTDVYIKDDNVYYHSQDLYNINSKRKLIGQHNLENIMFALTVGKLYQLDQEKMKQTIANFTPLAHRIEYVGKYHNIHYYDDAIATIPNATINALEALKDVDTLIIGGMNRGINYQDLIDYLKKCPVRNVICMPETGYMIAKQIENDKNVFCCDTLEEAVAISKKITKPDTICLLSPAAASYNRFKNYIEKGNKYQELVKTK